jgi:hypothetical protein
MELEGRVGPPKGSSGFTEIASSYKKSQKVSGISTRLAPGACSGINRPCGQLIAAVSPASASDGASRTFLFHHCSNLQNIRH